VRIVVARVRCGGVCGVSALFKLDGRFARRLCWGFLGGGSVSCRGMRVVVVVVDFVMVLVCERGTWTARVFALSARLIGAEVWGRCVPRSCTRTTQSIPTVGNRIMYH